MNEIDLIPEEYHRKQLFTGWLKLSAASLVIISIIIIGLFMYLRFESINTQHKIEQLQSQKAISNNQRQQLEKLNLRHKDLDQQLKLLAGLRSGAAAEQMFVTIDNALPVKNVWITGWNFRRAGTAVKKVDASVHTGYFVVIPHGTAKNSKSKEETWKIETQMTIQGQSRDHAALSEFILNLTQQPEIENVRVVNTKLTQRNKKKKVDFNLDIVVSTLKSKTNG